MPVGLVHQRFTPLFLFAQEDKLSSSRRLQGTTKPLNPKTIVYQTYIADFFLKLTVHEAWMRKHFKEFKASVFFEEGVKYDNAY